MTAPKSAGSEDLYRLFREIGRASLVYDIQDSHSGNMAVRWVDPRGRKTFVITATGCQKGDLEPEHLCFLSPGETDYGYYKASSESNTHARILNLPGVEASMHAHVKDLIMATLDDAQPPSPPPFRPVDPLGRRHLGAAVPVDWYAVPIGSPEMAALIPERLARLPVAIIYGHGAMAKGRTLGEAFFRLCIANNAGAVVQAVRRLRIDVEALRDRIDADPEGSFACAPPDYDPNLAGRRDFPAEEEIGREFVKAGHRIFESRLSPFHTGSMSVRGAGEMLYAPMASMPRGLGGPLLRLPLDVRPADGAETAVHKAVYAASDFQTVMHCYVPEAEAAAHYVYPDEREPADRVVPVDAEGTFLYPVIPVLPPRFEADRLVRLLHDDKVVIVRGGGVWAAGAQSLSEVLHHPSSVREICLYRIAAVERGLDLRRMEPEKAKRR